MNLKCGPGYKVSNLLQMLENVRFFSLSSTYSRTGVKDWSLQVQVYQMLLHMTGVGVGAQLCPPGVEHAHDGGGGQLTAPRASGLQTISCWGLKERIHHPVPWMVQKERAHPAGTEIMEASVTLPQCSISQGLVAASRR